MTVEAERFWRSLVVDPQTPSAHPGQLPEDPTQTGQPARHDSDLQFFRNIVTDQVAMWTSPLRTRKSDTVWLLPIAGAAAIMRATDTRAARELGSSDSVLGISKNVSRIGSGYSTLGASAALYTIGKLTHNDRSRETGLLGAEAIINSALIVDALKLATNRQRPDHLKNRDQFLGRATSFPSGHAAMSWALAEILAQEYPRPSVRFGAYGFAAAVSLSRFTDQKHYPSDIVVGGTIGFLVGRYVFKHHSKFHDVQP